MGIADQRALNFYLTPEHECSYLPEKTSQTLFADPAVQIGTSTYSELIKFGFRRSGTHVYRPHCPMCDACIPIRIDVAAFRPSRSQRRNWQANADLEVISVPNEYRDEHFMLYRRYMHSRHPGGGMDTPDPGKYSEFLINPYIDGVFYEFRLDDRLLGVAVVDVLEDALSAVYTYFDPHEAARGLGVYAVLWQIAQAKASGLGHVYLGYWIKACQKMAYKDQYRPFEVYREGTWQPQPKK
ncbi:arginyltransferase [Sulfuriflexus mobilis]|uniref:arginyltransferase n=1 Tax=Sulfuriflexus mobilis TaxID=1811807 RepID=UPI000F8383C8|nr:arginyltransferase [Sulfuriflexus mobilis]